MSPCASYWGNRLPGGGWTPCHDCGLTLDEHETGVWLDQRPAAARVSQVISEAGYQTDGTYVPCPECKHAPPPGGVRVLGGSLGTMVHDPSCPSLAWLDETRQRCQADLNEIARLRRKAAAKSRDVVIW